MQLDAFRFDVCFTVPHRWLTGLVACVAGKGRWMPLELDHVSVRNGEDERADVRLRFASDGDETGRPRAALMGVVMAVLEHLRERAHREHADPSTEEDAS